MAHLFLSYAHADLDRVQRIYERLTTHHARYLWYDKTSLRVGDQWERAIQFGIHQSYGVIFALSQAFLDSTYIPKEIDWALEKFGHLPDTHRALFIVRLEDVKVPAALAHIQYIDALDPATENLALQALDNVLPPPNEGGHHFVMPFPRLLTFKGREGELKDLHHLLKPDNNKAAIKTAGLHGMGGIGKTQLAVEFAYRYRFFFEAGVYWVNAAANWQTELVEIAKRLNLKAANPNSQDYNGEMVAAFAQHLDHTPGDALLVLDNVEDPTQILYTDVGPKLRLTDLRARLLITTRRQDLPDGFAPITCPRLPRPDGIQLLQVVRPAAAQNQLSDLCQAVDDFPLGIASIAATLKLRQKLLPQEFLIYLKEQGLGKALSKTGEKEHVVKLEVVFTWHWAQLAPNPADDETTRDLKTNARALLTLAAAYGEAARLPLPRLRLLSGLDDDPDGWTEPFSDAWRELVKAVLAEPLENALRLHPLIREFVRQHADCDAALIEGAARLLTAYRTPAVLDAAAHERDFDAVIEDLRETVLASSPLATQWGGDLGVGIITDLKRLQWFFDLEAHHLRIVSDPPPQFLIQQIRERAHLQSDDGLRDACDEWLEDKPHFATFDRWRHPADPAMLRIFGGHTNAVICVAFSPDGKTALSGSIDTTVRLWDVVSGLTLRIFEGHTDMVRAVAFAPDGKTALSGSFDRTMRLWDVASGQVIRTFEGHTREVSAVAFAPGGTTALSGAWDKTVRLWDVASGQVMRTLAGHTGWVEAVAFGPDGKLALSGSVDTTLRLWDVASGQVIRTFEGHTSLVNAVAFGPDGKLALSGSDDETARLWDIATGQLLCVFEGHAGEVSGLGYHANGLWVFSVSYDGTLRIWDIQTGACLGVLRFDDSLLCMAFRGDLVAVGGQSGRVYVLRLVAAY